MANPVAETSKFDIDGISLIGVAKLRRILDQFSPNNQSTPQGGQGINARPNQAPGLGMPPMPQVPPQNGTPMGQLKIEEIKVEEKGSGVKYFIISFAAALILGSLVVLYLQSAKGASANQAEAKYNSQIKSVLDSSSFKKQDTEVQKVGSQVASLKTSLAQRIIFSKFFKELDKVSYKNVKLTRVLINKEGQVSIEGVAPSYYDLAKEIDGLHSSNQFKKVELYSAEKQTSGQVNFVIAVEINKNLLSNK